jgi:PAS domain S-box-containing protein
MPPEQKVNILLVDDHPENLLALEAILEDMDLNMVRAYSGSEALKCLLSQDFALILLDVQMPGMDGFETAALIRGRPRTQNVPIIFLTAINKSDAHVFRGYSLGAVDYLFKPIVPEVLKSKIATFVNLHKASEKIRQQGEQLRTTVTALEHEILERQRTEEELRKARDELEARVKERTAGLAEANQALRAEIAERQRAEEALRASESRFRRLFESNIIGVMFNDLHGHIFEANDALLATVGYTREDLRAGQVNWRKMTPPEYRAQAELIVHELQNTGVSPLFEQEFMRKDGSRVTVAIAGAMLEQSEDRSVAFILDMTARKRAEEHLKFLVEATRLLTSSLDYHSNLSRVTRLAVPYLADWCAVDMLTENGHFERIAVSALHREHEELDLSTIGRPVAPATPTTTLIPTQPLVFPELTDADLIGAARDEHHLRQLRNVGLQSVLRVPMETRGRILGFLTLATAESRRHYTQSDLSLVSSLARRIAAAIDNAQLYQRAEAAVHARDAFLSIAAHELKTPLTALLGYADMLRRRIEHNHGWQERDQRAVRTLWEQSHRLNKMIASLLDLSRIQTGQLSIEHNQVDLCALVRRLVDEAQPMLDQHTIQLQCLAPSILIEGDELRLEQVLQNLLGNAIKYSPNGGTITVQLNQHNGHVAISISDQGLGIPADALPRLFSRFYRATNVDAQRISGMGVGLYVVKEIITLHGGKVEVTSQEGYGSTFTIHLPVPTPVPILEN